MRITNSIILRGYNRDLNRLSNAKNAIEKKITSTRQFSRASENPINAAKALNVRKSLYYSGQYQENLKTANKFYTEAESSLLIVSEKMAEVRETLIAACNTTKDKEEYSIYAQQLETFAKELVSVFNANSAERAIFGGESDDGTPFTYMTDSDGFVSTILYHGVPVNASSDPKEFPYSNPVTVDIGLGMVMDQKTQEVDPQSVLDISFNGAKITGCGADAGTADIDLSSIQPNKKYCIDVYAGGIKKTIDFNSKADPKDTIKEINIALEEAYKKEVQTYGTINQPKMDDQGVILCEGSVVCVMNNTAHPTAAKLSYENDAGYTDKFKLNFDGFKEEKEYKLMVKVGDKKEEITFDTTGTTSNDDIIDEIQAALDAKFGAGTVNISKTYYDDPTKPGGKGEPSSVYGTFSAEGQKVSLSTGEVPKYGGASDSADATDNKEVPIIEREMIYSNNYIQLTVDAARALRTGDIEYANGCIDRIVSANQNLLITIADLGSNEEFIDFNLSKLTTRDFNLDERQNDLETVDPAQAITLWKTYEALYNACLQMSTSVIPNSIFNYMS